MMGQFPNPDTQFSSERQPESNGRPKGSKSLATIIRELERDDFDWKLIPAKSKDAVKHVGSPFKAIVVVAVGQALDGDKAAREWLRKAGYGDRLDLTTLGKELPQPILGSTSVHRNDSRTEAEDTQQED